jgi:predicted  nucleic acid-binding Zn-ribbon protein
MFAAEVLSQLRTLNWLAQEIQRVPADTREGGLLREQIEAVRARLPHAILAYHDRLAARGQSTAAQVEDECCGVCRARLPAALRAELAQPGHFGVCPQCGVFVWRGDEPSGGGGAFGN